MGHFSFHGYVGEESTGISKFIISLSFKTSIMKAGGSAKIAISQIRPERSHFE